MKNFEKSTVYSEIKNFRFPRYNEITDIGLYLDQLISVVETALTPLLGINTEDKWITASMISNYVKQGIIPKPENKRYGREQLAYLIFICTCKTVLPLAHISEFFNLQRDTFSLETSYDYFCNEFENILMEVFGEGKVFTDSGKTHSTEAKIVRASAFAVAHKIYLNKYIEFIKDDSK